MILGIHWLRACYYVKLFGHEGVPNLAVGYQGQTIGLSMLPYVLIAGTAPSASVWLTNIIGLLGGFGWEGVSALILLSGFSLTVALNGRTPNWRAWLKKRAARILIPFYLVAIPFLAAYVALLAILPRVHRAFALSLDSKLHSLLHTPPVGVVLSHTLLFDPFARQWQADFFAPAWWFIPAILLAYAAYPALLAAARRYHPLLLLFVAAAISVTSYALVSARALYNETWYFIVMQELFNFTLGIVIGNAWLQPSTRLLIERRIFSAPAALTALALFVAGNIANWSPTTRPFASILYGPSLVVILAYLSKPLARTFVARFAGTDAYDLYLVHQPFAFPVALGARALFHSTAVFFGWFAFVAISIGAALVLGYVKRLVERLPLIRRLGI
jgi:peptidoglycan/LPS O-acetylase OafA/YrhL